MVADLVHQDMGDYGAERFLGLGPIIENRPPVEEHHVGHRGDVGHALARKIDPGIEPEQIERRFDAERIEHVVGGKFLDADEHFGRERAEAGWEPRIGFAGDGLELGEVRRFTFVPVGHARYPPLRQAEPCMNVAIRPGSGQSRQSRSQYSRPYSRGPGRAEGVSSWLGKACLPPSASSGCLPPERPPHLPPPRQAMPAGLGTIGARRAAALGTIGAGRCADRGTDGARVTTATRASALATATARATGAAMTAATMPTATAAAIGTETITAAAITTATATATITTATADAKSRGVSCPPAAPRNRHVIPGTCASPPRRPLPGMACPAFSGTRGYRRSGRQWRRRRPFAARRGGCGRACPGVPRNCDWRSRRSARAAPIDPDSCRGTSNSRARATRSRHP